MDKQPYWRNLGKDDRSKLLPAWGQQLLSRCVKCTKKISKSLFYKIWLLTFVFLGRRTSLFRYLTVLGSPIVSSDPFHRLVPSRCWSAPIATAVTWRPASRWRWRRSTCRIIVCSVGTPRTTTTTTTFRFAVSVFLSKTYFKYIIC